MLLSDYTSVNVQMDGHKMTIDNGELDIPLAVDVVFVIYHILQCCLP